MNGLAMFYKNVIIPITEFTSAYTKLRISIKYGTTVDKAVNTESHISLLSWCILKVRKYAYVCCKYSPMLLGFYGTLLIYVKTH